MLNCVCNSILNMLRIKASAALAKCDTCSDHLMLLVQFELLSTCFMQEG